MKKLSNGINDGNYVIIDGKKYLKSIVNKYTMSKDSPEYEEDIEGIIPIIPYGKYFFKRGSIILEEDKLLRKLGFYNDTGLYSQFKANQKFHIGFDIGLDKPNLNKIILTFMIGEKYNLRWYHMENVVKHLNELLSTKLPGTIIDKWSFQQGIVELELLRGISKNMVKEFFRDLKYDEFFED